MLFHTFVVKPTQFFIDHAAKLGQSAYTQVSQWPGVGKGVANIGNVVSKGIDKYGAISLAGELILTSALIYMTVQHGLKAKYSWDSSNRIKTTTQKWKKEKNPKKVTNNALAKDMMQVIIYTCLSVYNCYAIYNNLLRPDSRMWSFS